MLAEYDIKASDNLHARIIYTQTHVLATSADSSKGWDLRCDIREKLIAYIQKHHPQSLPKVRAEFDGPGLVRNLPAAKPV